MTLKSLSDLSVLLTKEGAAAREQNLSAPPPLTDMPPDSTKVKSPQEKQEAQASDLHYPSSLAAEHVYVQMAGNFPPEAIAWVRRAKWEGPVYIPWDDIDTAGKKTWAAAHQPEKVAQFKKQIKAHDGHVAPSILVRQRHGGKSYIVDGHHRALAREELNQDVLAYVGVIDPGDREAAEQTHSSQIHQGSDPGNK
jgi:ParB/Sulfiredoxin domain